MSVTTLEDTGMITITEAAVKKLKDIMAEKGISNSHALRVFISGSGCNGLQYGMGFDTNIRAADTVFDQYGMKIIVDSRQLPYLEGASVDYWDDPVNGGFQIENPNTVSTCGGGSCSNCK